MFVPFCSVQRRSTGSMLPGLGCIFKITRHVFRNGLRDDLVVHNRGVGAAIGDGHRRIVFGNGVQFRPGEINHDLPGVRTCWESRPMRVETTRFSESFTSASPISQ